jgi:cell division protein ZapA (FtsZ GTPase activity inhibitor)
MKEKYTISIADVTLNVIADGNKEQIERIVGIIDRRMREILLKSPQCPKTQAALLIALDLCADKMDAKAEVEALREQLCAENEATKSAKESYDRAQSLNLKLEADKAELIAENAKLRAIIENAKKNNTVPVEEPCDVEQLTIEDVEAEEKPAEEPKKDNSRSRVGSMFDLLTFSDI